MKTGFFRFIISSLFILFFQPVWSQTNLLDVKDLSQIKIESLSDNEIKSFYDKAIQYNIGEDKAIQLLSEKGLPVSEIEKLKSRLSKLTVAANQQDMKDVDKLTESRTKEKSQREAPLKTTEEVSRDYTIFGAELFGRNSLVFEPNLRIATPSSYVLGPDDEIILNIFGYSEKKYNLEVNQEGQIYIPNVGPVFVSGLTIEQATKKITSKLSSTIYTAIKSGQTGIQLTLGKIRSIRVSVIGEVTKPGTYTVSSLTTLFNLLYLCGGPSDRGSYRMIELVRGNKVSRVIDLYQFLLSGIQSDNVLLQEGDLVRIPFFQNRVSISGSIRRPGKYEMTATDSFSGLLKYCGGFSEMAYKKNVTIFRIDEKEKRVLDVASEDFSNVKPQSGDEYIVGNISDHFANRVSIQGSVFRPGYYELKDLLDLEKLINHAGGLKEDAYSKRISVFRYLKDKTPTIKSVDLDSLRSYHHTFALVKEDSIVIHSIFDLLENKTVSVEGNVNTPNNFTWRENLTLGDVLIMSGGLNSQADSSKIEISRTYNKAEKKSGSFKESERIILNIAGNNKVGLDFQIMPFDIISVKVLPGVVNQRSVLLLGDVVVPGRFILETSNDRVGDVIKRADGFRYASDSSIIYIRRPRKINFTKEEREKVYKKILGYKNDTLRSSKLINEEINKDYDLIGVQMQQVLNNSKTSGNNQLNDGDIIVVNRLNNLVKISGEVSYPNIVTYVPGKKLNYYIRKAGGYMPSARKSSTVVVYPDGSAMGIKRYLIFKKYPRVTSDAELFVPLKEKSNRTKFGVGELAIIISALTLVTNTIISINKN